MNIFYTLQNNIDFTNSIYLAGPTYRNLGLGKQSWRNECLDILKKLEFNGNIIVPEWIENKKPNEWTYSRQVSWEQNGLKKSNVILFWIPRNLKELPGLTTNIEFGEYLHSGKIVIGSPEDSDKNRYLKELCSHMNIIWHNDLKTLCENAINKIYKNKEGKTFYTSDLHFSDDRVILLSKRPFMNVCDMDFSIIRNWNCKVTKNDNVFILGDIGNIEMLKYLNYKGILLIRGNYDSDFKVEDFEKYNIIEIRSNMVIRMGDYSVELVHEPSKRIYKECYLFGHIHKLGMIKRNGLNVGMDCHNYCPIDETEILFYLNAIKQHYDEEVFLK